jgi:hypothetical protein
MVVLVVIEGVAVALLGVLVAGLLRTHADILRSLHRLEIADRPVAISLSEARGAEPDLRLRPGVPRPRGVTKPGFDVAGTTPTGDAVQIGVVGAGESTVLAFLSSGCQTCAEFWRAFATGAVAVPGGGRLVIVTKGPDEESPASIQSLAPPAATTVMSTAAWADYRVRVVPYFVYVHGPSGEVVGEGAAGSWAQISSLLEQALVDGGLLERVGANSDDRHGRIDAELMAAGIHPGHPSLYPAPLPQVPTSRPNAI